MHCLNAGYDYLESKTLNQNQSHRAYQEVLAFFKQSREHKQAVSRTDHPEIGYRAINNKELVMLRDAASYHHFPTCEKLANELHQISIACLQKIATKMGWPPSIVLDLIEPALYPEQGYASSVLRLNHYAAENSTEHDPILSPTHEDLGLLTFVCPSDVSGLEIYDFREESGWNDVEAHNPEKKMIVMAGESLSFISNGRYIPAPHRVRRPDTDRTSLVYHLRLRADALLDSSQLETEQTGRFAKPFLLTAREYLQTEIQSRTSVNKSY